MANLTGSTSYFPTASETYSNNLSSSIASGAATVPVNSASAYTDGDLAVITVDAGTANEATFAGIKSGNSFINCIWTEGNTGVGHSAGAPVVDYDSATHFDLVTKGILKFANQDGSLKTTAVQTALNLANTPAAGWNVMAQALTYAGNAGQKEFTANFTGDVTSFLQAGHRLLVPRGTAAPTQSMLFASASSQYATRASASVAGLSFTATFTCEAFVYLPSYNTTDSAIISRLDVGVANGFQFWLKANGQLAFTGYNAGSANWRQALSNQSLPTGRWVHVAVTWSTGTVVLYLNGAVLTSVTSTSGTAPTTIVNTGDLSIGRPGAFVGNYFNGNVSEARIWSVAQSQASILANMGISLTGAEANLVFLAQGNGNFNDKTSNGNNLTANAGAIATNLINPYHSTEYFIVTKVGTFSGGLTPVTLFAGTDYVLPNQALGTVQYSAIRAPYGFPASRDKWVVDLFGKLDLSQLNPVAGTWYNLGYQIAFPTGAWEVLTELPVQMNLTANANTGLFSTLSTSNSAETDYSFTSYFEMTASTVASMVPTRQSYLNLTAMTTYFTLIKMTGGTSGTMYSKAGTSPVVVRATSAYV